MVCHTVLPWSVEDQTVTSLLRNTIPVRRKATGTDHIVCKYAITGSVHVIFKSECTRNRPLAGAADDSAPRREGRKKEGVIRNRKRESEVTLSYIMALLFSHFQPW